jgi:exodeoxyribonuclease-3
LARSKLRIVSWNVNGLRACGRKGFADFLRSSRVGILGIQEVRALETDLDETLLHPRGFQLHLSPAKRLGYSGVGVYSRRAPTRVATSLGEPEFDVEGRVQFAHFGRLVVVNAYFPKGSGRDRDNSRVAYKLAFTRAVFDRAERLRRGGKRVLVMGDFNTAHREIDLARPKGNQKNSGFLPEERAELDRIAAAGWVDTFRAFEPDGDHYSWWSQRFGMRAKNVGWRIDLVFASPAAMRFVRKAFIWPEVMGSDHCPVGVDVDPAILD